MPFDPSDPAFKEAVKEGIREWLDGMFISLGKWTAMGLAAAALAGLVYLAITGRGFKYVGK